MQGSKNGSMNWLGCLRINGSPLIRLATGGDGLHRLAATVPAGLAGGIADEARTKEGAGRLEESGGTLAEAGRR